MKTRNKIILSGITIALLPFVIISVAFNRLVVSEKLPHGATLRVFPVWINNNHRVIIICPGGGYVHLAKWREGYMWVPFFHQQGYTVAVLEYRSPNHNYMNPTTDGAEAIMYLREQSDRWDYSKDKIGIMGFSAGGHLASAMMVTENDDVRPDYGILMYPVVSMKKGLCHKGSRDALIGINASSDLENRWSNELHVTEKTPPVFIAVSSDDNIVNPQNSFRFYEEMKEKRRSATIVIYPSGGHGWGYNSSFPYHDKMKVALSTWLEQL